MLLNPSVKPVKFLSNSSPPAFDISGLSLTIFTLEFYNRVTYTRMPLCMCAYSPCECTVQVVQGMLCTAALADEDH